MVLSHIAMPLYQPSNQTTNGDQNFTEEDFGDYYDIAYRVRTMLLEPYAMIVQVIGVISIVVNILVLLALNRVRNKMTNHHRFIMSLAISDTVVSASVMFHVLNQVLNPNYKPGDEFHTERLLSRCTFAVIKALNTTGLNATLLSLMALAIDHYVAILRPLQYPLYMIRKRTICGIVVLWVISVILGFSDFFSAITKFHMYKKYLNLNYCEAIGYTRYEDEFTMLALSPLCLTVIVFIYTRIYIKVLRHRRPGASSAHEERQKSGIRKASKALITTLLNILTFICTWLPLCLFQITMRIQVSHAPEEVRKKRELLIEVDKYLFALLMLNAIADPVIYAVRIQEVKLGLARLFKSWPCCSVLARTPSTNSTMSVSLSHSRVCGATMSTGSTRGSSSRTVNSESHLLPTRALSYKTSF